MHASRSFKLLVAATLVVTVVARRQAIGASPAVVREAWRPMCEDLGYNEDHESVADLMKAVEVDFTPEEEAAVFETLGLGSKCQEHPKATWILGPSASGKSTVTRTVVEESVREDAVLLDGDVLRKAHPGYMNLVNFGLDHSCIFKTAWPRVFKIIKAAKAKLLRLATDPNCQRNLLAPETCTKVHRCKRDIDRLQEQGYSVDVLAVFGPKEAIVKRGKSRGDSSGKAYSAKKFSHALAAFTPTMEAANGECILVDNTVLPPTVAMKVPCPGGAMRRVEDLAIQGAQVTHEEFAEAQQKIGVTPGP